jgi:Uncharacterized protein conserved in bacteria
MKVAYVDTSCIVARVLGEEQGQLVEQRLAQFDSIGSSNLLEAEFLAAMSRESKGTASWESYLEEIEWIVPQRPLSAELAQVLAAGYVRGADCWHLATALYSSPDPSEIVFVTLDQRQLAVAEKLGFRV